MGNKKRVDVVVAKLYPQYSRRQIQSWIMQGKVTVNGKTVTKSGTQISPDAKISLDLQEPKYVSRAGFKLEKALDYFNIDVTNVTVLDAGISTGGFTDCLLQRGAKKIYGIDVGYGQVHEKVANNPCVTVFERTNLRKTEEVLQKMETKVDMVTLDLSFISVLKVMETVVAVLKDGGKLIVLIKPQFEAEKKDVGRGGIIKDEKIHKEIVDKVTTGVQAYGFTLVGVIDSPILGSAGNKEFLAYFNRVTVSPLLF